MTIGNQSLVTEIFLQGFSVSPQISIVLFVVYLIIYLFNLIANGLIIAVVRADVQLQSPMYLFICNLSLIDICLFSTIIPKCLDGLISKKHTISISGCLAQVYICLCLGTTECTLLMVMAWDRFLAICNPLNYQRVMSKSTSLSLFASTWASGIFQCILYMCLTKTLQFCSHNINNFGCEAVEVLHLSCSDISKIEAVMYLVAVIFLVVPLVLIFCTYLYIILTILKTVAPAGRQKAFSTCGSHITVVTIFYGTAIVMHMSPRSTFSEEQEKIISSLLAVCAPTVNPLIYTLKNKDVKEAIHKLLSRIRSKVEMLK